MPFQEKIKASSGSLSGHSEVSLFVETVTIKGLEEISRESEDDLFATLRLALSRGLTRLRAEKNWADKRTKKKS